MIILLFFTNILNIRRRDIAPPSYFESPSLFLFFFVDIDFTPFSILRISWLGFVAPVAPSAQPNTLRYPNLLLVTVVSSFCLRGPCAMQAFENVKFIYLVSFYSSSYLIKLSMILSIACISHHIFIELRPQELIHIPSHQLIVHIQWNIANVI